jgi:hypothetical protein
MKKAWKITAIAVLSVILFILILLWIIFNIRFFSARHLDDVSPGIPCEQELLEKASVFYVIPKFENKSIAENSSWCEYILSMNKTLAIHGVYHTFNEFGENRSDMYLDEGLDIFKKCFGFYPTKFKPPQLEISRENMQRISKRLDVDWYPNTILHKTYHCSDSDKIKNRFIDMF